MKTIIAILTCFASFAASAQIVNGYFRDNGTYVQPHFRSAPDGNPYNNYGHK